MSQGFVAIHRQIRDNKLWFSEKFSGGQAWVDLIMLANHKPACLNIRGNYVDIKRGQMARSKKNLGEDWKWSEKKVNNFLKLLQKEGQIKLIKTPSIVIIEITNYDIHQQKEGQKKDRTNKEEKQKMPNNNVNNDKNENNPQAPKTEIKVFKEFRGGIGELCALLDEESMQKAKDNCKGWNFFDLLNVYISWIKQNGLPDNIKADFPSWCLAHTKGKSPR
jgi:hydroxymethylpyrimidine pyrophosphatase-like HAD family hydrolase